MDATAKKTAAARVERYASDPLAFLSDLIIPGVHGPARFGDVMATFQRERFAALAPALLAVARGEKPPIGRFMWEASKGTSKDTDLAAAIIYLLIFTLHPLTIQVGAADQEQAGELKKAAKLWLHLNPWLADRITIQNWRIVCERSESTCDIIAADVAGSHGSRPDVLILNELSCITKDEYAETLMDNATKVPHGIVVVATNAGFTDSWQWRWRELARQSDLWSFHRWAQPSPWLDPAHVEEAKQRNSRSRFERLFMGVWASGAGDALSPEDIAAAVRPDLKPMRGDEAGYAVAAGLDLSTRRDHSAFVGVACHLTTRRVRLAWSISWKPGLDGKIDLAAVRQTVLDYHEIFGLSALIADPHQASLMVADFVAAGINAVEYPFVGKNLDRMASTLLQVFREREIDLYDDPELIRDLGRLSIQERAFGFKLEAPRDRTLGHCDKAIALSIVLPWATEAVANYQEPIPDAMGNDFMGWLRRQEQYERRLEAYGIDPWA